MSSGNNYNPPDPLPPPLPIFNNVNWIIPDSVVTGGGGGAGTQGLQGLAGLQGLQGLAGLQGVIGVQGVIGLQGNQGFQGLVGLQGHQGFEGLVGLQGRQGLQGHQGLVGSQGNQGNQGSASITTGLNELPSTFASFIGVTGLTGATSLQFSSLEKNNLPVGIVPTLFYNFTGTQYKSALFPSADYYVPFMNTTGQYRVQCASGNATQYISTDFGRTWQSKTTATNCQSAAISATGQYFFVQGGNALYRSSNFGSTFTSVFTNPSGSGNVWCCASQTGEVVYVTANNSGIHRSIDYGTTWTLILADTTTNFYQSPACSASGQYFIHPSGFSTTAPTRISNDYGRTFRTIESTTGYDAYCSSTGQYIYYTASAATVLKRSTDYGMTFSTVSSAPSGVAVGVSASGQVVIAGQRNTGNIYISNDYGNTFMQVHSAGYANALATPPAVSASGQYFMFSFRNNANAAYQNGISAPWNFDSSISRADQYNIILNGLPSTLPLGGTGGATGFYVQPIRFGVTGTSSNVLMYNEPTREIFCMNDPVYIGSFAGQRNQQLRTVAIGYQAGQNFQNTEAVAIGHQAGMTGQNSYSVALGSQAGRFTQGQYSVALGYLAGTTAQASTSIGINATGVALPVGTTGFYVKPVRAGPTGSTLLSYDNASGEIYYTQRSTFAQYYDTTDQPNSGATGNTITLNTTDFQRGVSLVSNSRITVPETGYYAISYSLQFINVNNSEQYVDVWFEKNGTTIIPNSNSEFGITRNQNAIDGKTIAASTFFFNLVKNDYLEIRWFCASTDVDLEYIAAGTYTPATPSAFVNIQLISN